MSTRPSRSTRTRGRVAWALASIIIVFSAEASAKSVALLRPATNTPILVETVTRLHGELLAVGMTVHVVEQAQPRPQESVRLPAWTERLDDSATLDAAIEVVGDKPPFAVDVWLLRTSPQPRVSRVLPEPPPDDSPGKLAVRAVEVLRAAFLEMDLDEAEHRKAPLTTPTIAPQPLLHHAKETEFSQRWGLAAGAVTLSSLDGVGLALLPLLRIDSTVLPWLTVQATFAGMGTQPEVASGTDVARLAQYYGLLGARYRFRETERFKPFLALSAGALQTTVAGHTDPTKLGHTEGQWSLLAEGSAGAELRLLDRYYATLSGHLHLAKPSITVHILDEMVATTGRPNVALALSFGAWL